MHILIAFDDKWFYGDSDNITKFLDNAFYPITNYSNSPYPNSKFDLRETVEALNEMGQCDYFKIAEIY